MSRAFVKEPDGDQVIDDQPEWPISTHTNYVTSCGLQQLKDKRVELLKHQDELTAAKDTMSNKVSLYQVGRELRYFTARIANAQLIPGVAQDDDVVSIGSTVKIIDENDNTYEFTIVGEDEADIKLAKISWVSPLARALLGRGLGDAVIWKRPMGDLNVEIDEINHSQAH